MRATENTGVFYKLEHCFPLLRKGCEDSDDGSKGQRCTMKAPEEANTERTESQVNAKMKYTRYK